jgi:hypothetical protein
MDNVNNLAFWESVEKSDPESLKQVNKRNGFTAISAQYQIKKATEVWGQYGYRWGVKGCKWSLVGTELVLEAIFYYPSHDWVTMVNENTGAIKQSGYAEFEMAAGMLFKPGDECHKKLLTDFTTKALSKLGFNADVFMDKMKWDGHQFVDDSQDEYARIIIEELNLLNPEKFKIKEMTEYLKKNPSKVGAFKKRLESLKEEGKNEVHK